MSVVLFCLKKRNYTALLRADDAPISAKDRIVILITIDGFPAWMLHDPTLPMPNLRRLFFFSSRRRHTRYWRDWSSDVCSSDLPPCTARSVMVSPVHNRWGKVG